MTQDFDSWAAPVVADEETTPASSIRTGGAFAWTSEESPVPAVVTEPPKVAPTGTWERARSIVASDASSHVWARHVCPLVSVSEAATKPEPE
jgi:hypothetical protein